MRLKGRAAVPTIGFENPPNRVSRTRMFNDGANLNMIDVCGTCKNTNTVHVTKPTHHKRKGNKDAQCVLREFHRDADVFHKVGVGTRWLLAGLSCSGAVGVAAASAHDNGIHVPPPGE